MMSFTDRLGESLRTASYIDTLVSAAILTASGTASTAMLPVPVLHTVLMLTIAGMLEGIYHEAKYGVHDRDALNKEIRRIDSRYSSHVNYLRASFKNQKQENILSKSWLKEVEDIIERDAAFMVHVQTNICLLYTSPSPRDRTRSRMPSSA